MPIRAHAESRETGRRQALSNSEQSRAGYRFAGERVSEIARIHQAAGVQGLLTAHVMSVPRRLASAAVRRASAGDTCSGQWIQVATRSWTIRLTAGCRA